MLQKNNKCRILKAFFKSLTAEIQPKQICRLVKIFLLSTKKYLQGFEAEGIVAKSKRNIYLVYKVIRENLLFKSLKKWSLAVWLTASGFSDYVFLNRILLYGCVKVL